MKLIIHQKWYLQQVKDTFTNLQAPRLNWALRNALNITAKQVKRFTETQVSEVTSAKSKRVKKGVYIKEKATAKFLETDIIGSGTPIPLKFFQAKETKRGVTYKMFGKSEILPHAFIKGGAPLLPYQDKIKKSFMDCPAITIQRPDGTEKVLPSTKITSRGLACLREQIHGGVQ
ncbi:hypothetical protein ABID39_001356 [Bartonella japonica]|uniref:Antirepressor protein C-terminal domain-containing protein n=1 Tax=Bartonella japonica TaxID=357761 RepID=A0ABV2FQ05_9HYPH